MAIAIDFGTSTTLVARRASEGSGRVVPIGLGQARSWMPSLASIERAGCLRLGEDAEAYAEASLIRSVKTALANNEETLCRHDHAGHPVEVPVADVVTGLLAEAVNRAQQAGAKVADGLVRLACPAIWSAGPRQALVDLARVAGLDLTIADLLDEPIAAGVSWVMNRWYAGRGIPTGRVVVFDYGGGTLDIAVLEVNDGTPPEITVLSALGSAEAGDRLDELIAGQQRAQLQDEGHFPEEISDDVERLVRRAATRLKEGVSIAEEHQTAIGGSSSSLPLLTLTRTDLETLFAPQLERSIKLVYAALRGAELRKRDVPEPSRLRTMPEAELSKDVRWVLLSGGMTRIPCVRATLAAEFTNAVVEADEALGAPEESVVSGLTFDVAVSELNLHRPGFNFIVTYRDRDGRFTGDEIVYPAFTPLYSPDQIFRGEGDLGVRHELREPNGKDFAASLTCRSVDGFDLDLQVDNKPRRSIDIPLSKYATFKLYVDGRVLFGRHKLRVDRWPVLRQQGRSPRLELATERPDLWSDYQVGHWWTGE